jgi:hypothetical protein
MVFLLKKRQNKLVFQYDTAKNLSKNTDELAPGT